MKSSLHDHTQTIFNQVRMILSDPTKKFQKGELSDMNQTQSITAPRSKTYEITMTALMAAVTCILAPLSIPIGPVPISFTNLGNLPVPVSSRMEKRNDQLSDLSSAWTRWSSGIFRFHRRSCKTGRSYRRIYHRIYRYGSHRRTGD